ncbi:beta-ketoacyl-[acyl-carrier-protein] synthase family protein [Bremerella cremea]|uniref:3-oxoacyl-ACP synthase n=1 Tax=Blastopirellula marina TaxID=124 RepID=A0A2S8FRF6_9BACT|nr:MULTISPECIES: beta-ketoacyl-[acyl-carrier-protein] synthase family protein [Pirellulaceae]PQO34758.1 3-oxoacyl-ACP synthase [Blastopirellula marina]RCS47257.1 beta-ketoacyl-[acyl-carrier-protein] synthase family protein [Bremerella cremea]
MQSRRVVITGMGQISPLGMDLDSFANALGAGVSGIRKIESLPADALPSPYAGEATEFTGHIGDFGDVSKEQTRSIRKNLKVMCREIQMGVAAAQRALQHSGLAVGDYDPEKSGVIFGSDYMMTLPEEFDKATAACLNEGGEFAFEKWAEKGLPEITPLWLLKYLPNMPASHVAIFNDMRGPNNSITLREASAGAALGEAMMTIARGHADVIISGSTGTRVHETRTVHTFLQDPINEGSDEEAGRCLPFDLNRRGMVIGEGAGALVLESLEHAEARGAKILGEVLGQSISTGWNADRTADRPTAIANALAIVCRDAGIKPGDIQHINSHGLGAQQSDWDEAAGLTKFLGDLANKTPVIAMKSYFGNLGAGSGIVEVIGSLLAQQRKTLPGTLGFATRDPKCDLNVGCEPQEISSDGVFVSLNFSPQGQASAIAIRGV